MTRKCRTCAHNTCEGYSNECTDCTEHSEWKEALFVQEIRREEREACARICDAIAADLFNRLRAANECNFRDCACEYRHKLVATRDCAGKIRAEGSGR